MEQGVQEHEQRGAVDEVVPVGKEEIEFRHGQDGGEGIAQKDREQGAVELEADGGQDEGQQAPVTSRAIEPCSARQQQEQERRRHQDQMQGERERQCDGSRKRCSIRKYQQ